MAKSIDLRKIQRQIVRLQPMHCLGLGLGDDLVRLGQILPVIHPMLDGIGVLLRVARPEQIQDNLSVLRVVLVPPVVQGLDVLARRGTQA